MQIFMKAVLMMQHVVLSILSEWSGLWLYNDCQQTAMDILSYHIPQTVDSISLPSAQMMS